MIHSPLQITWIGQRAVHGMGLGVFQISHHSLFDLALNLRCEKTLITKNVLVA
jgi:hypothetical protein